MDLGADQALHKKIVSVRRDEQVASLAAQLLRSGVAGQVFPGAAACIAFQDGGRRIFVEASAGTLGPALPRVDTSTLFDLASVTKPVVAMTALALVKDSLAKLDLEAGDVLIDAKASPAARASLRSLMRHTSGLAAWGGLYLDVPHALGSSAARRWIVSEAARRPGEPDVTGPVYSDLGYIVAGAMVAKLGGQPLDRLVTARLMQPLGIADQVFYLGALDLAQRSKLLTRCAATERCEWRGRLVRGEVHDENCAAMGGVAGHAGLFGTARGVAHFGAAMVDVLADRGNILSRSLLEEAMVPEATHTQRFGWDGKRAEGSSAGRRMGPNTFGHLGFTGTSLWCDPDADVVVALLTNRVCPSRANHKIKAFRPAFHDAVVGAVLDTRTSVRAARSA